MSPEDAQAFVDLARERGMDYPSPVLTDLRHYIKLRTEAQELLEKNSSLKELLEMIRADDGYAEFHYSML